MSMTLEQRKVAAFNTFFSNHIEDLRTKYVAKTIDPVNEFISIVENNDVVMMDEEKTNVSQALENILNNSNASAYYQFEGGRYGDELAFDLYDYVNENEEIHLWDDYTYLYKDNESELSVGYRETDLYIHIEIWFSDYAQNYVIELR